MTKRISLSFLFLALLAVFGAVSLFRTPAASAGGSWYVELNTHDLKCSSLSITGKTNAPFAGVKLWDGAATESANLLVNSFSGEANAPLFETTNFQSNGLGSFEGTVAFPEQANSTVMRFQVYGAWNGLPVNSPQKVDVTVACGTPIPSPVPSPTPVPTPTPSPIPTPVPTPTPSPSPSPVPSPSPTPVPTFTLTTVFSTQVRTTNATIMWSTSLPSTSRVRYGTRQNSLISATALDSTLVTSHQMLVANLKKNTTYYYQVESSLTDGTTLRSPVQTFKTHSR